MKKIISLSIDSEVYEKFSDLAHSIGRSTSSMIEEFMRKECVKNQGTSSLYVNLLPKKEHQNVKTKTSEIN